MPNVIIVYYYRKYESDPFKMTVMSTCFRYSGDASFGGVVLLDDDEKLTCDASVV